MISSNEVVDLVDKMLKGSGFNFESPDAMLGWNVFKKFTKIEVECTEDALLFECGVFSFTGEPLFYFDFVRLVLTKKLLPECLSFIITAKQFGL